MNPSPRTPSALEQDLASGLITRVVRSAILDDTPGWIIVLTTDRQHPVWAYAPHHLALLTGEIAREITLRQVGLTRRA